MARALVIALISALVGAAAGYGLGRAGLRRTGWAFVIVLATATALMLATARDLPGFEGIARMILSIFFIAPSAAGMALGLWQGLRRRG
jgi:hypothetical protein